MSEIQKIKQTPRGIFEWVNIRGEGKEDLTGNMKYQIQLVLDPEGIDVSKEVAAEHAAFIADAEAFWKEHKPSHIKEAKSMGFYPHTKLADDTDEDGEKVYEETGKVSVMFKTGTTYKDGKNKLVKVFNGKNKEVEIGDLLIGNGSEGRVAGAMATYEVKPPKKPSAKALEAGVTFYLDGIKLLKLVEYQSGPQFGTEDDDEEGGWTGESDGDWEGGDTDSGAEDKATNVRL